MNRPSFNPAFHQSAAVPLQANASGSGHPATRYHLIVTVRQDEASAIQVFDRIRGQVLFKWQGVVVRHLIESGALPERYRQTGCYACDKSIAWHLALAGAAATMVLGQFDREKKCVNKCPNGKGFRAETDTRVTYEHMQSGSEALCYRLDRLRLKLPTPHMRVAQVLFAHPGQHFSTDDICDLLLLDFPWVADERVRSHLLDLSDWSVIQRIAVDADNVFYDIDTTPHLHLFDPRTRQLEDAPANGIVHAVHGPKPT